eukprot:TRINITY_DN8768_c0_g1_i1.p1 TRINITY_DN8768_c0_g1~~TRINITY_DN8768_c0_g1_i1.p1  ORF type:complete len:121 (-),score=43.46 TRINITY_DN8768_c0_g1_i1:88-450(-)
MVKEFTLEDVAKHNTDEDIWVVYEDKVLDLTAFLADHPGGEDVLTEAAGQDITQSFLDIGHSETAIDLMEEYLVGKLKGGAKKASGPQVKTVVTPAADATGYLFPVLIIVLSVVAYYLYA